MKVETDVTKTYYNASQALADEGFTYVGEIMYGKNGKMASLFEKDGEKYYFISMEHYNTTIYSVKLRNVKHLKSYELIG